MNWFTKLFSAETSQDEEYDLHCACKQCGRGWMKKHKGPGWTIPIPETCPYCESPDWQKRPYKNKHAVKLGRRGGLSKSKAKTLAARKNGALGGRPLGGRLSSIDKKFMAFRPSIEMAEAMYNLRQRDGISISEQIRRALSDWLVHKNVLPPYKKSKYTILCSCGWSDEAFTRQIAIQNRQRHRRVHKSKQESNQRVRIILTGTGVTPTEIRDDNSYDPQQLFDFENDLKP